MPWDEAASPGGQAALPRAWAPDASREEATVEVDKSRISAAFTPTTLARRPAMHPLARTAGGTEAKPAASLELTAGQLHSAWGLPGDREGLCRASRPVQ